MTEATDDRTTAAMTGTDERPPATSLPRSGGSVAPTDRRSPRSPIGQHSGDVQRFDGVERAVHWLTGVLTLVLLATGAILWFPSLSVLVNNRQVVKWLHLACGFALPLPLVAGLVASRALRLDTRRLGRFAPGEWRWFRGRWPSGAGKFNPGQKLNAAFVVGMIAVMLLSGLGMLSPGLLDDEWRTGLTIVHDTLFVVTLLVVAGHIAFALRDPVSLRGMLTGRVARRWAARHHPNWTPDRPDQPDPDERP